MTLLMAMVVSTACRERVAMDTVRAEFNRAAPPREARLVNDPMRPKHRSVSAHYITRMRRAAVARHYATILSRNGWTPCGETVLRDWGRDVGHREYNFSKGELDATVFFPGTQNYGYSYSVYIGPSDDYPWEKAGCRR